MIQVRLKLPLEEEEYAALIETAAVELRSPADQVRYILRQDFERRGLLPAARQEPSASPEKRDGLDDGRDPGSSPRSASRNP